MRLRNILILLAIFLALGGYIYFSGILQPATTTKEEVRIYVWDIDMEELERIKIELPREGKSEAFIKEADRSWHFDDPQRSEVNMERWGGGIPLLLSGPGAERVIAENATPEKLAEFGLTQPRMRITLTLENDHTININVGDSSPNANTFYVQAPGSNDVALVDYTWYDVMSRLVTDPPYATPAAE